MVKEFCCCAIPVYNAGIYLTIAEQFSLGVLLGTLSLATTSLVGAVTPSFAPYIVAAIAYVFAGVQLFGFIGVFKEKAGIFAKYSIINSILVLAELAVTATFTIISATSHQKAVANCEKNFFAAASTSTGIAAEDGEGKVICEIFTWTGVGLMGGLWLLLVILQGYLILVIRTYGKSQRDDHKRYYSLYNAKASGADTYAMTDRATPPEPTYAEATYADEPVHHRQQSNASSMMGAEREKPYDTTYGYGAGQSRQGYATGYRQPSSDDAYLQHPSAAVVDEPGPTPNFYPPSHGAPSYTTTPQPVTYHPAEGSFGRKTPRAQGSGHNVDTFDQNFFRR